MIDAQVMTVVRTVLAAAGTLLLAWKAGFPLLRRVPDRWSPRRDQLLGVVGILSLLAWWNFGYFHFTRFAHLPEFFHYYLGAKYHSELGYTGLYRCVVTAALDNGVPLASVSSGWVRDLDDDAIVPVATEIEKEGWCRERFTPARWDNFRADVRWFHGLLAPKRWNAVLMDHGYNATPLWTVVGTVLANSAPASERGVALLASVDTLLIVGAAGALWWTFGWEVASVAAIWWGTNYLSRYYWVGGGFLRMDWLALAILGLCLLRRNLPVGAGIALAYSALLRVFPACLLVGILAAEGISMARRRSWIPRRASARCLGAAALTTVLLVPLSSSALLGTPSVRLWDVFLENSVKHQAKAATNRVGLKSIVAFDPTTRLQEVDDLWLDAPYDMWYAARTRTFDARRPIFLALVAVWLAVWGVALIRQPPLWVAAALSIGLMPIGSEFASYYYSVLLMYAILWNFFPASSVGLAALAMASNMVLLFVAGPDERHVAIITCVVIYVFGVTALVARRPLAGQGPAQFSVQGHELASATPATKVAADSD